MCYHAGSSSSDSVSISGRVSCLTKCLHTFTLFVPHTHTHINHSLYTFPPHYECAAPFRNKLPGKFTREIPWQRQHGQRATRLKFCRPHPQPPAPTRSVDVPFWKCFKLLPHNFCAFFRSIDRVIQSVSQLSERWHRIWAPGLSSLQHSINVSVTDWLTAHTCRTLPPFLLLWFHLPYVTTV